MFDTPKKLNLVNQIIMLIFYSLTVSNHSGMSHTSKLHYSVTTYQSSWKSNNYAIYILLLHCAYANTVGHSFEAAVLPTCQATHKENIIVVVSSTCYQTCAKNFIKLLEFYEIFRIPMWKYLLETKNKEVP